MSEHQHVYRQLTIYRELSAAERRSAERHAQECAVCAETLTAYAKMDRALADLPPLRPDPALRSKFQAALLARRKGDGLMNWRQIPTAAAQLAFLLAVLFLGWMLWQQLAAPEETVPAVVVDDREDETEATAVPATDTPVTGAPTLEATAAIDEEPPTPISTAAWPQTQTVAGFPVTLRDVRHDEMGITLWLDITAWGSLAGARLMDDQGRPYFQQNATSEISDEGDLVSWEISFNRPSETARRLTLFVSLEVHVAAEETVTIDLDGRQIGDQWEIQEAIMVGGLPTTFSQAALAPPQATDAGTLTARPSLELTADSVVRDNARLLCLFLQPTLDAVGYFGGCRTNGAQVTAYYELQGDWPTEPLSLAARGQVALQEAYAFSWNLPGQPEFEPPPVTAVVPQSLTPIFQANRIKANPLYLSEGPYRWSADNQWVAFWSESDGQPGTIHFLNTHTMQTCPFPQELNFDTHAVGWLPGGEAVVYEKSRLTGWRGVSCGNDWQAVEDISQIYLRPTPPYSAMSPISPGGDYLAEMRFAPDAQGVWLGTLTIQDRQTGTTLNTATWQHMGNTPNLYVNWLYLNEAMAEGRMPEGYWLDSETYLVDASLDQGPLLVTAGGDVIRPALDVFNVPDYVAGQGDWYLTARAVKNPISQAYDFLLSSFGYATDESPYPLLYHSGSGIVERLDREPPPQLHDLRFVGNGRWLIRYPISLSDRPPLWIRPLTPPGNELYTDLTNGTALIQSFAPYADYMADIEPNGRVIIRALPEGTTLAIWDAPDYRLSPEALWSRDGRYLLVAGEPRSGGQAALFLIPVE